MDLTPFIDNVYTRPLPRPLQSLAHLIPAEREVIESLNTWFPAAVDHQFIFEMWPKPKFPVQFTTILGAIAFLMKKHHIKGSSNTIPPPIQLLIERFQKYGNCITSLSLEFDSATECPIESFEMPPPFQRLINLVYLKLQYVPLVSLRHFPARLPRLKRLGIQNGRLTSLAGFPQAQRLEWLNLHGNRLRDCEGFPDPVPHLRRLDLSGNRLRSLIGLPRVLPACTWLSFKANRLRNVHGFPRCPQVEQVYFDDNRFPGYAYRISVKAKIPSQAKFFGSGNPRISLHGLQPDLVQCVWRTPPADLPASYRAALHAAYSWPFDRTAHTRIPAAIANLFAPAPTALAFRYIAEKSSAASEPPRSSTPGSSAGEPPLSDFERDRIVYEGDLTTLRVLLDHLPLDDPVLTALARHLEVPLQRGKFLI